MNKDFEFDDADLHCSAEDARLERILREALSVPEISPEFREQLFHRLSDSLAAKSAIAGQADREAKETILAFAQDAASGDSAQGAAWEQQQLSHKVRVLSAMLVAASLFLAVGFWVTRPAYGWADMLASLERCNWVKILYHADTTQEEDGPATAVSWYSSPRQVLALQGAETKRFVDLKRRRQDFYLSGEDSAIRTTLEQTFHSQEDRILHLLLPLLQGSRKCDLSKLPELTVLEERWHRKADKAQAAAQQVTLEMRLKVTGLRCRPVTGDAVFELDSRTARPLRATWKPKGRKRSRSVDFDYPQRGPDSIYALEVEQAIPIRRVALPEAERAIGADQGFDFSAPTPAPKSKKRSAPPVAVQQVIQVGSAAEKPSQLAEVETPTERVAAKVDPAQAVSEAEAFFQSKGPLPPPLESTELVSRINETLASFWDHQGVTPAQPAKDAEFLRRVYLDLTGRIPMVSEYYEFMESDAAQRRRNLVEDLLGRRDHATHLATVWRKVLLPEGVDLARLGGTEKFDSWLADRFAQNVPYDQIVEQLLLAEGRVSESGPLLFYAALEAQPRGNCRQNFAGFPRHAHGMCPMS